MDCAWATPLGTLPCNTNLFFSRLFVAFARPSCWVAEDVSFVDGLHQLSRKVVQVFNLSGCAILTLCWDHLSNLHEWGGFSLAQQCFTMKMASTLCEEESIGDEGYTRRRFMLAWGNCFVCIHTMSCKWITNKALHTPNQPQQNCHWFRCCSKQI